MKLKVPNGGTVEHGNSPNMGKVKISDLSSLTWIFYKLFPKVLSGWLFFYCLRFRMIGMFSKTVPKWVADILQPPFQNDWDVTHVKNN